MLLLWAWLLLHRRLLLHLLSLLLHLLLHLWLLTPRRTEVDLQHLIRDRLDHLQQFAVLLLLLHQHLSLQVDLLWQPLQTLQEY